MRETIKQGSEKRHQKRGEKEGDQGEGEKERDERRAARWSGGCVGSSVVQERGRKKCDESPSSE